MPFQESFDGVVRIHATTVNRTDCGLRAAKPFIVRFFAGLKPRVTVLGSEFAGEVVAVGSWVTSFSAHDRVFGYDDSRCGGDAEYKTIAEDGPVAFVARGGRRGFPGAGRGARGARRP